MCYYSCQAITISRCFNLISNSWENPRWRPLLVTSQASSSATIHKIYLILSKNSGEGQWRIQGRGPRGPPPQLFFDQNEARRAEKKFFWTPAPPPYLRGLDDPPSPFHLPSSCTMVGGMILRVCPRIKWFFKTLAR